MRDSLATCGRHVRSRAALANAAEGGGQIVDVPWAETLAGLGRDDKVGRAADMLTDDDGQPRRHRFIDDEPPRFQWTRQHEAIGRRVRAAELPLIQKPGPGDPDAAPRGLGPQRRFAVALANDQQGRLRPERRRSTDRVADAFVLVQLADIQHDEGFAPEPEGAPDLGAAGVGQMRRRHPGEKVVVDGMRRRVDARRRDAVRQQMLPGALADR